MVQVALYLMMLEDRYGVERIGPGLLWYLNDPESGDSSEMIQVDNIFLETAALVRGRNALLSFLAGDPISLPPMLGDERTCTKCFAVAPCAILHKVCFSVFRQVFFLLEPRRFFLSFSIFRPRPVRIV